MMVSTYWRWAVRQLQYRSLALLRRFLPSSLDFLTLHYIYIIGMTLLGSLLIFAGGSIRYIDALFLASSSCTQAGLAPVNINDLNTWQQVVIFLLASLTNPIVIHSATAFVRLYWFQRRFAHIVQETNLKLSLRKSRSRAVNHLDSEEKGVAGREIRVLFNEGRSQAPRAADDPSLERQSTGASHRRKSSVGTADMSSLRNIFGRKRSASLADDAAKAPQNDLKASQDIAAHESTSDDSRSTEPSSSLGAALKDKLEQERLAEQALQKRTSEDSQAIADDDAILDAEDDSARPTADIRFAALPVARKDSFNEIPTSRRLSNLNIDSGAVRSKMIEPFARIGSTLAEFGQRTMTIDGVPATRVHHRRPSNASRMNARTTTLDKGTGNLRRRRDSSAGGRSRIDSLPYISFQPTIGRNSAFMSLTKEQRAELGGIEYRATKTLCWVLVSYFFGFQVLGFICYVSFIFTAQQYIPVINNIAISRGWWSIFTSASSFNDLGLTLTPDSFVSFQNAAFLLLASSLLIVAGNTGFPCVLRLVIWIMSRIVPRDSALHEEFAFLLDHPRRCFTLLFPSAATWWLVVVLVALNGLDLILFMVLDLDDPAITSIPVGYRIVDGLFQAFCTRTAGFTVVNLSALHSAVLVSYLVMMYVSVFPVAISIRRTNVYEERSLGIYSAEDEENNGNQSFVGTHIRRQLGFDLWYIFLALFIICIIENPEIQDSNLQSFNIFNILFEIISAYGTVGLSLGYPTVAFSFSGVFHTLSKLVIIALQIRGRHRGLPLKLDRAILLPSEKLIAKDEEEAELRLGRRSMSFMPAATRDRTE